MDLYTKRLHDHIKNQTEIKALIYTYNSFHIMFMVIWISFFYCNSLIIEIGELRQNVQEGIYVSPLDPGSKIKLLTLFKHIFFPMYLFFEIMQIYS